MSVGSKPALKTLRDLCVPRKTVFDRSRRDSVLDLTDLLEDKIKPGEFFEENFRTEGMTRLMREAFRRLDGQSQQGVFVLSQAMGGGKTHNMIALGLLAKHPEIRKKVIGDLYDPKSLGTVRVVAFTGRESDAPFGIWGAIADQVGKKEAFKNYYSPLSAPGQSAWVNLLKGEPTLILLDELPPYLDDAKSKPIGDSNLAKVTTTAISNLLVAVGKEELSNVCVVISDLKATYQGGSAQINDALNNLQAEVGRGAVTLEPVGMNTDEIYHILRTRLFVQLPDKAEIRNVARAYADAVRDAKQMDITSASPEKFVEQLTESYPFHFAIRDLYARFRENPGFQQTRGLIRLMRVIVSRLYDEKEGRAGEVSLIHAHDLDLNDRDTVAEIMLINPTLDNAISHDIASAGQSVSEILDASTQSTDAQDVTKLLLISSLANVPNALLGLSLSEIVSYLCTPGRDISKLPKDVIGVLTTRAWYLHANREGRLYFKNVQNLVAKLKTTAEAYTRESSRKELRSFLEKIFAPSLKDTYQQVAALPALDEIEIKADRVTLVISEPYTQPGLHPDLVKFYEDLTFKNRVVFLSGARDTMQLLLERAAELKAIGHILSEMDVEKVPQNDPQRTLGTETQDKIQLQLLSAARETFTTLTYPTADKLMNADFLMNFNDNNYNGEKQIREVLKQKQKFTEDTRGDIFQKKCEARLFTQKNMQWTEIKRRAATNPAWNWHHPNALDDLKDEMVRKEQWREAMGWVEKGPFPLPTTSVDVHLISRNDDNGEATLRLVPRNGDTVHYEIGGPATTSSSVVSDPRLFRTRDLELSFLCIDSKGKHETGDPVGWKNTITLKHRIYQNGGDRMMELQAAPANVTVRYTTDGSDPAQSGGIYESDFAIPRGTVCVLAVGQKGSLRSEAYRIDIPKGSGGETVEIDPHTPAVWKRSHKLDSTKLSYEFLAMLAKHEASVISPRLTVAGSRWVELATHEQVEVSAESLEATISQMRKLLDDGQVSIEAAALRFPSGQRLLDWLNETKTEARPGEVKQ
jgi:hypothetical protein